MSTVNILSVDPDTADEEIIIVTRRNACRFCNSSAPSDELIKYGTRHYAHPACYLDAGKKLSDLPKHEISGRFPFLLLVERGLEDEARRLCGIAPRKEQTP